MMDMISVQLLQAEDIQAAAAPSLYQGVKSRSAGAIYFPDQVLTVKVDSFEGDPGAVLEQWSRTHRFILASFSIAVRPEGERIPESVDVTLAFADAGDLTRQPIVLDVFPSNGFKKAPFEGSASVAVTAKGGLEPSSAAGAAAEAKAGFSYTYAPAYADVASGFGSASAFWRFNRTQDAYPIGEIPMKMLIAAPRALKERALVANFDVRAAFSGWFFSGGAATASFTTAMILPDGD